MNIFETREANETSIISRIGNTVTDIISVPLNFVEDVVKTPFDFVSNTVGGLSTKIVLIGALAIVGLYIVGKYKILQNLK